MISVLSLDYKLYQQLRDKVNISLNKQLLFLSFILLLGAVFSQPSWAQSIKSAADGTNTTIKQDGNQFNITGGRLSGDRTNLFQSFNQFNLDQNQIANFLSQPNIKNILGRVVGGNASVINGLIKVTGSNANLFLINPAGIVFGTHAQLNVPASFTATTATGIGFGNNLWFNATGLNNYTSLVGNPESFAFNVNQPGSIINAGLLQVGTGQNIFLLGGNVINTGTLTAPEGNLTIAAVPGTSLVKVSQTGHLLNLEIAPQQGNTAVGITPLTLPELLTGHGLNPATAITVDSTGQISLTSSGVAIASGNLNVAGHTGGAVNVLGNNVNLINANINAAGIFGGGQVLIGGDEHGRLGTVPNAQSTFVDQNTRINADALTSGNGGKVIVWSDNNTVFSGNISAQGGNQSGNGGFVEVSGKQRLQYDGLTDLRAANGAIGNLLLDPATFVIANSGGDITPTTVANQWDLANTTYSATTSLTVTDSITGNSSYNLTLDAPTINLNAPITNSSRGFLLGTTNNTTVNVGSSGSIQNGIDVAASGGNINLAATTYTVTGQIELGKSLTITGMGANNTNVSGGGTNSVFNIDGSGTNVTLNALNIINGNTSSGNGGGIQVGSGSNLNLVNSAISGNSAQNGGGIYNNGTTTISNSTISGNSVSATNILSNGFGGGIYNNGTITISNSTISGNSASANNILSNGFGGGIYNNGTITISNSTISGNSASANILSNGLGGGIYNNGTITITNSIIAGNTATTSSNEAYFSSSSITSLGYNLVGQNGNAGGFPEIGTDIILSGAIGTAITALGYYGGTTQTYALVAGSPAIDAGNITASTPAIDQRGAQRGGFGGVNAGSTIDIGSFEASSSYLVTNTSDSNNPSLGSLRAAVNFTNSGLNVNNNPANITTPATNTINFDTSGTFATPQTIVLSNPTINITKPVNLIFGDNGITITGDLTTAANGTIGLSGILTANNLSFNDPVKLLNNTMIKGNTIAFNSTVDGDSNLIANVSGGNLTFAGAVGGTTALGNINTDSSGITSFNTVTANSLTTSVDGTTQLNANITTTNAQTYNNPVTLTNNPTLTGNGITFNNTVDGNSNLTANTTSGNITFAGTVGGTIALGDINTNSTGTTSFNTVTANSLTTSESGTTQLNADITTTNAQTYNNPVTLTNNPTLIGNGITFNNTVDGNSNLTANTTSGNITFAGTVGGTIALGDINTNSSGVTSFNTITANSLTTSESGTTQLNANITTTNAQTYNNPVTLANNSTLIGNGITFNNTVDGNSNLTANTTSGNITFAGTVGGTIALGDINTNSTGITSFNTVTANSLTTSVDGTTQLNANITTTNAQTYNNPVTLANSPTLIGNGITFNNTVDGNSNLTANTTSGNITFAGTVGGTTALGAINTNSTGTTSFNTVTANSLTTSESGTTQLNANITTTNAQTYNNPVTLANNPTLTGNGITFNNTLDGNSNLTANTTSGNITFAGTVGGTIALGDINTNSSGVTSFNTITANSLTTSESGTTQLNANITTTNAQTYNNPVTLANSPTLIGNGITFNNTVDGNSNLTANTTSGNIAFAGTVGGTIALGDINTNSSGITSFNTITANSLTTSESGTTQLNANITTTNAQTYNNPVTLANSPTLIGNGITFNNTVDGNSNLTANTTSGNITFAGTVGGTIALGDINTNSSGVTSFNTITANSLTTSESGTTQLNANITTTNAQTYNNPVTLANSPTLTGNGITFNNTVDGNSNLTANTTSGNITFAGTVGGTIALGDINTNSSGITSFNTVTANSLTTSESGTTQLNGNINTQGGTGQSFGNPVQLVSNVSLNSNNKNIIFSNTINGTNDLTVNAGTNNTTFVDAIGNNNPLDNLTVTGNLINIDLTKVTTTGAQTYNGTLPQGLQGSLTIANSLNFSNPINLTGNTVLNFIQNIASVKFAQGLNGTYDLTLNKNIGNLDLIANLGNTIPLSNFTINSPSSNLQANITTTGNQTYNGVTTLANSNLIVINGNINFTDAVNLTNTSTLKTGGSINFFKTVDGSQNLNLTADGDINFDGAVGSSTPLAELTINNAANVIGGNINAGSIDQATGTGSTQLGNITTTSGGVNLTNRNDIITGDITTNGQDINLNGKDVFTGNLNSSAAIAGGNISLFASNQIIVKSLDSSANLGNGGNVTIDPLSVSLDSINAQGGTTGSGGIVDITSFGSFRATGTFTDRNGTLASISTAGGAGSGDITIRYGAAVPFTVGDATVQGTAGAITSAANNTIAPTRSFFTTYTQGNISLIPYQPIPNFKEQDIPLEIALSSNEQVALDVDAIIREKISTLLSQENLEAAVPLIEDLWDSEYQGYYGNDLQPTADIQTAETIQSALKKIAQQTGKKSAIVYIICQYNSVELLVITPEGKILHKSVKVSNREALLELTKQFRNQLVVESDKTGYKSSGRKLYNLLIKPIEPVLTAEKIDTLLFSVDSGLRSLPLAALYDGHQFLVEKYSLSIIPSVSLMDTRYQSLHNANVLAMGASKFLTQSPLPSVTVELPIIVQNFGQKHFFINEEFTVKNLLAQHQQHPTQIIHLATHGLFNPGTPKNSYIQFWNQEKLQLDQLRNLNLKNPPVELFVLSACRTALGNEEVELGFAGLAVQAGSKSALASLWSVSDEGSLVLMNQFYQNLKTTPIKAEALRQAQIAMIQGRVNIKHGQLRGIRGDISLPPELGISGNLDLSHPYYWAAFTMIGSPW